LQEDFLSLSLAKRRNITQNFVYFIQKSKFVSDILLFIFETEYHFFTKNKNRHNIKVGTENRLSVRKRSKNRCNKTEITDTPRPLRAARMAVGARSTHPSSTPPARTAVKIMTAARAETAAKDVPAA
jgi:hypothetical protein